MFLERLAFSSITNFHLGRSDLTNNFLAKGSRLEILDILFIPLAKVSI